MVLVLTDPFPGLDLSMTLTCGVSLQKVGMPCRSLADHSGRADVRNEEQMTHVMSASGIYSFALAYQRKRNTI